MGRQRRRDKKNQQKPKNQNRKNFNYSEEDMLQAYQDVIRGKSISKSAKDRGVPYSTLHYKATGKRPIARKMGPATVLTLEEEDRIVNWIATSSRAGFPVTKANLLDGVQLLIEGTNRESKFTCNRPGRSWYDSFMRRHPSVSVRVPQNLTSSRSSVSSSELIQWSDSILKFLSDNDQVDILDDPARLFNGDETAFFLSPKGCNVLAPKGDKTVYQTVNSDEKECITVLITANAAGVIAPPLIVFKYERIPLEIASSVPNNWGIGKSESGWMNGGLFFEYITNCFHPWLIEKNFELPVIFFLDGHTSHLNIQTAQFCNDNGIILVALYPNATHLIQPMDVAVFRSVKGAWRQKVHDWRIANLDNPTLKKKDFAPLLKEVLDNINPKNICNGFRKCGLYPWDAKAPTKSLEEKEQTIQSPPRNVQHPKSIKGNHAIEYVEKFLGQEKLKLFEEAATKGVNVHSEDISIFQLWKEIRSSVDILQSPTTSLETPQPTPPNSSNLEEAYLPVEVQAQPEPAQETSPNSTSHLISPTESQAHPEHHEHSTLLPSPFKKAFIYRDPVVKSKKNREMLPSVVSSQAWRDYHESKAKKKLDMEIMKKERAVERERKKKEKEELQKRKREEREQKNKKKREEREQKKRKTIPTKRRNTRKKKLPSSSESEEWRPSDESGDDFEGVSEDMEANAASDLEEEEAGQTLSYMPEVIDGHREENRIISEICDVAGLDIMDLDFDVDGTNTNEIEGSEIVQSQVSIVLVHDPNEVDAQNKSQNEENMIPQLKELTCMEELIETSRREEEKVPEDKEEKNNTSVFDDRSFILVRFKNKKGEVDHVCRVKNILPDGCLMVILMRPVSRIGKVYNEDLKDIRKISPDQVLRKMPTPRVFGSNFQFFDV